MLMKIKPLVLTSYLIIGIESILLAVLFPTKLNCERLHENDQVLIVLSFSGLDFGAIETGEMPFVTNLAKKGSQCVLKPVFPSTIEANHHTYATGLYIESHGVPGSGYFDYRLNKTVKTSKELYEVNPEVIPVWILNEIEGGHSGCLMWPGSEVSYMNRSCTYYEPLTETLPLLDKARLIQKWILNKEKPANLIMFFSNNLATRCASYGPKSYEAQAERAAIDEMLDYLIQQLKKTPLKNRLNFVILGDQGYSEMNQESGLNFHHYISDSTYEFYGKSPVLQIVPDSGYEENVYRKLSGGSNSNRHFDVYSYKEFPKRWHANHSRLSPILIVAESGFQFITATMQTHQSDCKLISRISGATGYEDPVFDGALIANGPFFKTSTGKLTLAAIDVFPILCHVLHLQNIPPHNESGAHVKVLKGVSSSIIVLMLVVTTIIGGIIAVYLFIPNGGRKGIIIWKRV